MKDVIIIGGGITGLATAYYLMKEARAAGLAVRVKVIEAATRFGGKVVTERQDGFVVEGGPDAVVAHKPWALELIRELGLEERLLPSNDDRRRWLVLTDRRLVELPAGSQLLAPEPWWPFLRSPLLTWRGKLSFVWERFVPPGSGGDESLADFVRRRFGNEVLERLAEPLLAHIHVADPERMSLQATYPHLAELEKRCGSLRRGMAEHRRRLAKGAGTGRGALFWTLRDGLAELIEALAGRLDAESRLLGRRVAGIRRAPSGATDEAANYQVVLKDGSALDAAAVVLATPANVAAGLLAELDRSLADGLEAIRYVSIATLSLGFRRHDVRHPLDGFGFFVPRRELRKVLACTWTSSKFDLRTSSPDHVLLRVFLGGAGHEEMLALDDERIVAEVGEELRSIMGLEAKPIFWRLYRWNKGYPQYDVGHLERAAVLRAALPPGLYLAGSAYDGVGLPDCIRSGLKTARELVESLGARRF